MIDSKKCTKDAIGKTFKGYLEEWQKACDEEKFSKIIIWGNGEGALNAPVNLLWDKRFFRIGINRAFLLGHMHVTVYRDDYLFSEIKNYDFELWSGKGWEEWEHSRIVKSTDEYRDEDEIVRRACLVHEAPLGMGKNTLHAGIDLACRISRQKVPIILCGVDFGKKWHFYGDRFNQQHSNKDSVFFDLNSRPDGRHTIWKKTVNIIKLLSKKGFKLYYTDESKLLKETGIERISYEDLNCWI